MGKSIGEKIYGEKDKNDALTIAYMMGAESANDTIRALKKRIEELEAQVVDVRESERERFLSWRGIETACEICSGTGIKAYGNTATWMHGIGGQMITNGVCDHCWGSGDKYNKGVDLKALKEKISSCERYERNINEALNSGDGVYRP